MLDKALVARVGKQAWYQRFPRALPLGLFAIICFMTMLGVYFIERANEQSRTLALDRSATEIASALQRRAATNIAYLRAGAALFEAPDETEVSVFRNFVKELHLDQNYRGAQGIGWAKKVDAANVETTQIEGATSLSRIWPRLAVGQPFAIPVTYLEPETPANARALGYDMYSEPTRRIAMDTAARLDRPVTSGKVILVQENGVNQQAGFLIYMPVFERGEAGPQRLRGYVYSAFRAQDFLQSASELYNVSGIGIALYDGPAAKTNMLGTMPLNYEAGPSIDKKVTIGTRDWTLRITAPQSQAFSQLSRATLLFGAVVALLLLTIAGLITKRAAEDRQALEWQARQAAIRTSLTRELNHRVKNTLANVLSIIALTKRRATNLDDYVEKLTGRVRALSATHDLLTKSEWGSTLVSEVVEAELAPYREKSDNHVRMEGPDISLAPNDALSLGLAIHELATNATKYGALSTMDGIVHIHWHLREAGLAEVHWREEGGPIVVAPDKRGFGRDLIEKVVAHELKTKVDLQFHETGVECRLSVPVREHTAFELRAAQESGAA